MKIRASQATYKCAEGCSECCGIALGMNMAEAAEISDKSGVPLYDFTEDTTGMGSLRVKKKPDSTDCFFLENGRCRIYEYRPVACRLYPLKMSIDLTLGDDVVCSAAPIDRNTVCCEYEKICRKEKVMPAEELAGIAERALRLQASLLKTLKGWRPGEEGMQARMLETFRQTDLEEAVGILRKQAIGVFYNTEDF